MNSWRGKTRKSKLNLTLAFTVGILLIIGIVMLFSASAVAGLQHGDSGFYIKRQIIPMALGIILLFMAYRVDYHFWQKFSGIFFGGSVLLLLAVLFSPVGVSAQGATRWLNLGITTFQPAELVKLTLIIYLSAWLSRSAVEDIRDFKRGLLPFVFISAALFVLIIWQPDLGTFLVMGLVALALYFAGGANLKHIFFLGVGALVLLGASIAAAPYRLRRVTSFLNPGADPLGAGYHTAQAILAVGSGGLLGLGLGQSRQKFLYLPEVVGDSLFAVIAEELGFIFSILIILLFLAFLREGIKIALRAPDKFGQLLSFGIVFWICAQAFVNIGAMLGLLPLTGIPLPFMSFGGSAMAMNLTAVGILMNIAKQNKI